MPSTPTAILSLIVPTVGGDQNQWGTELNTDLATIDFLGAASVTTVSSSYNTIRPTYPEMIIRVTTSGLNVPINLADPGQVAGKIYTIKKIDAGLGTVQILSTAGIDNFTEWDLTNQYAFVRVYANGTSYDVIGSS